MEQGRATLPRIGGAGAHVISIEALDSVRKRGIVSFIHGNEIEPDDRWDVDSTFHIDFSPWRIGYYPRPLDREDAFFADVSACGFEIDPEQWARRDLDDD